MHSIPILALLFLTLASAAFASDGVLEINQTCAVQTGCFAGDTAGLPVTIDGGAGRSYRMTSDLVISNELTNGILVGADNVSIDLGGFEIRGPVVCSGTPVVCTPAVEFGGVGVSVSSVRSGTSERNGSIRGMGAGVALGAQTEITQVRFRWNAEGGIIVGSGSNIESNTVYQNGFNGIQVGAGSTISGNTTYLNRADGISAGLGTMISGNTAYQNAGVGIRAASGATVLGTAVRSNTGFGLDLGSQSGYRENVISGNTAGTVTGTGFVNLGNNACNGTTTCP